MKSFTVTDRGKYTQDERRRSRLAPDAEGYLDPATLVNDGAPSTPYTGRFRDEKRYPLRYTYEATGSSLAGARGTFTCASDTQPAANGCRVTNQNTHFSFFGPWVFTPDKSARIEVDDTEYMYFGWWARQRNPNDTPGTWTFHAFHGPAAARSDVSDIARLSGTATYKGEAAGYYSFFHPLDSSSDYGEFTAKASLTANFTLTDTQNDETVSGTIDGFQTHIGRPDWVVTLKQTAISGATVTAARNSTPNQGPVSWKIKDESTSAPDAGTWEAAFYSNLPDPKRGGGTAVDEEDATPTGIAGTFEAEYHDVGKMIGAFGAHKQP